MKYAIKAIDYLMWISTGIAACLIAFMMLSVSGEVVFRLISGHSQIWIMEIIEYSLLYTVFLGAAWLLKKDGHVKMDIVLIRLPARTQALVNIITSLIGAVACLIVAWFGTKVTLDNIHSGAHLSTVLEPQTFLIVMIVPFGSILLCIQFFKRAFGYFQNLDKTKNVVQK